MKSINTLTIALALGALLWSNFTMKTQETETKDLCVQPALGPIGDDSQNGSAEPTTNSTVQPVVARAVVGKQAPDFEANAYVNGGFRPVKLSDYRGKWVVLCFYPGDFTFV